MEMKKVATTCFTWLSCIYLGNVHYAAVEFKFVLLSLVCVSVSKPFGGIKLFYSLKFEQKVIRLGLLII